VAGRAILSPAGLVGLYPAQPKPKYSLRISNGEPQAGAAPNYSLWISNGEDEAYAD